jgi:hypothetical protein
MCGGRDYYSDVGGISVYFYSTEILNPNFFYYLSKLFFSPMTQQPPVGQGLLNIEASRSHSDTPHSVGFLWASDQPDSQTST